MSSTVIRGRPRKFDRDEALAKAMDVFWAYGYEAASINVLTEAMGINPPSLYVSFGNKEKLFIEVVQYYLQHYGIYREQALQGAATAKQGIQALLLQSIAQFYDPACQHGCLVVLAALSGSPNSEPVQAALGLERRKTVALIAQRLERGQQEGDVPAAVHCGIVAEYFATLLFGLTVQAKDQVALENLHAMIMLSLQILPD